VRLFEARNELQKLYHGRVDTVSADLSVQGSAKRLYESLNGRQVDVLINSAGCGYTGYSWQIDAEAEEKMVQLNDASLMTLCKLFLADFTARGSGTIVNVASTGAFQSGRYIAGYYASKAFVLNYTGALREEAKEYGVHVCCLCPGPVDTHFYAKSGGRKPRGAMSAEKVAAIAWKGIHNNQKIIIPGFFNRLLMAVPQSIRMAYVKRSKLKNLRRRNKKG
jgi:short-subunit dehydrogenase